jgi:hypothetical protein
MTENPGSSRRRRSSSGLPALLCAALLAAAPCVAHADVPTLFLDLLRGETAERLAALERIEASWGRGYEIMLVETLFFLRVPAVAAPAVALLEERTGQRLGFDLQAWYDWIWAREERLHPGYAEFKSRLYGGIDSKFSAYFAPDRVRRIRFDEVRWGGVAQDGIPPLRDPAMVPAAEASWLADDDVVFGLAIAGDVRAYPKRILGWHEMFTDTVGGVPVAGVYCTLCGTVIVFETRHDGVEHRLGTSGFLFRSNKLMYDEATQSLWNTIWGEPVIGPLAARPFQLRRHPVVTTRWGEWRRRHPTTLVLSLETGYERDYSEGAAYREYFATDELMFGVPLRDGRLANKDEVLTVVLPESPSSPVAFAIDFLAQQPVHHDRVGEIDVVVVTDSSGANRLYASAEVVFERFDGDHSLTDAQGLVWTLTEESLEDPDGRLLPRLPAQRAFWFGWYAAYPQTRLVR